VVEWVGHDDPVARRQRGHRVLPHTADVILEAWGPDLVSCCEEAVAALVGLYVDAAGASVAERRGAHVGPAPADVLLLDVLEDVIFALDTAVGVPVGAEVTAAGDGGLDVVVVLADRDSVVGVGAVPKAISRSDLRLESQVGMVRCRFLVDV
jgi:SHS2 domain-containing protein